MGRLRPNTVAAQTKRSTLHSPSARSTAGTPLPKHSVAGRTVVLVKDGEQHTYKLLDRINTFLHVVIERHKIFERRYAGRPGPWTDDLILGKARFTNVYRVLDKDTQFIITNVIPVGPSDFQECVFRVTLFRLFDRIETYEYLREELGPLTWKNFNRKAYLKALNQRKAEGFSLVGNAYQMPSPTMNQIGGVSHHDRLLRLLELMMLSNFAENLHGCYELCDLQTIIALYPSMGGFLGYQVILDLNMIPGLMLPEDWAIPGPGAHDGLRMIFGKQLQADHVGLALSWIHEHFDTLALAAGYVKKDIPALRSNTPGLSIVDIEHVLCEFSKYVKISSSSYRYRKYSLEVASGQVTRALPEHWKPARTAFVERNRKYTKPSADKNGAYTVSAILDEGMIEGELHYKVRWEGWGPDADTWESAAELQEQIPDTVEDFAERRGKIKSLLKKFLANKI